MTSIASDFFSDANGSERDRLTAQRRLLLDYDRAAYDCLLDGRRDLCVLDLGSGNGTTTMERLGDHPAVSRIVGVDCDPVNVERANEAYTSDKATFHLLDVESPAFLDDLHAVMGRQGITSFGLVNILALLAHLGDPASLLRRIKSVCSGDASILIRNIDDGLSVAYPDDDGAFARAVSVMGHLPSCGRRHVGRTVPSMLAEAGYSDIRLASPILTTVGMGAEDREALFETVFGLVRNALERDASNLSDEGLCRERDWYESVYGELHERFMQDGFFFSLGFLIYTAHV